MGVDLKAIEQLASDQASLKAAAGLAKPGKWSAAGASADGALIWAECAGSGANPYRVMADLRDLGSKCTCPSRKFPCKHALGLLWLKAEAVVAFPEGEPPEWVGEWLRRRRGGPPAGGQGQGAPRDIAAAQRAEPEAPADPKAAARREAAAAKRAEDSERMILDALDALEQWIGDQLRMGLAAFLDDVVARCRRIAARLVDGKAAALAGRIDELPSRLLALPQGERARGAAVELGKLVLLARAFRAAPGEPEVRRAVAISESREAVLADPGVLRVMGGWEVLAEQVRARRDGLVSQTTWLLGLEPEGPRFAMLLDYFPASAGRRASVFTAGERFRGELAFFPARAPSRAFLLGRAAAEDLDGVEWPSAGESVAAALTEPLLAEPWTLETPVLLPAGRIALDCAGQAWWRSQDGAVVLPVADGAEGLARGTDLARSAAIWSGGQLTLLAAQTPWGRVRGHG